MPKLIVLNGPAGVGKTTVAQLLHEELNPSFLLSCDAIRRFINDYHDMPREGRTLRNKVVLSMLDTLITEGMDVILEQLHTTDSMLEAYIEIAKKHHAKHYEFMLWVSDEERLLTRFHERDFGPTRHAGSSLNDERVKRYWHSMNTLRLNRNQTSTIVTDEQTPQATVLAILQEI